MSTASITPTPDHLELVDHIVNVEKVATNMGLTPGTDAHTEQVQGLLVAAGSAAAAEISASGSDPDGNAARAQKAAQAAALAAPYIMGFVRWLKTKFAKKPAVTPPAAS